MILQDQIPTNSKEERRKKQIMRQILDCYSQKDLLGKFRVDNLLDFDCIFLIIINPHYQQQTLVQVIFPEEYPSEDFVIQRLPVWVNASQFSRLVKQIKLLKSALQTLYQFNERYFKSYTLSKRQKSTLYRQVVESKSSFSVENSLEVEKEQDKDSFVHIQKRKYTSMNGCADKELTQTKNLNRHFRSKLRQVLRDLLLQSHSAEDSKYIQEIFTPNRVGFDDIRKSLKNEWFNEGVKSQMSSGKFLHKILRGMMGIKSKKLMIKYYHVMVSAVENPERFIRWKYEKYD